MCEDLVRRNVAVIDAYYQAWSSGDPEAIRAFLTPDFRGQIVGRACGTEELLASASSRRASPTSAPLL